MIRLALSLALVAACTTDDASTATQSVGTGSAAQLPPGPPGPPPPEALAACKDSTLGAACSFAQLTGTCKDGPDHTGPQACAPDRPPPPPEAIAACAAASAGAACSFDHGSDHIAGRCHAGPPDAPLACAPE
ncbi:MAG: hypothetical protein ABJE66_02935 [Deltaproteobacteria bacterium]